MVDMFPNDPSLNDILSLLSSSFVPEQQFDLDHPLKADAFKDHIKTCEKNLTKIELFLNSESEDTSLDKKLIVSAVLLCGEHSCDEPWTTPQTCAQAKLLVKLLLLKFKCASVIDLLLRFKIENILAELRPKLLKDSWKNNPAAVTCFIWILFHIKCPHLGDVLNSLLPTCLLLIDDHVYSNKIKGLKCLEHIANNVSRAELSQYGRGLVIYNALEHMVYLREPEVIPHLGRCLTALLSKTERTSTSDNLSWNHFDDVLNIWLPSMEMEQKLLLREAYLDCVDGLLQAMGLASVRWSRKLLSVLSEYSEQEHTRDTAVKTLLTFMRNTWPRLPSNFDKMASILMRVVIQLSENKGCDKSSQKTLKFVKQCFSLLENVCPDKYGRLINDLKNYDEMRDCVLLIAECQERDSS